MVLEAVASGAEVKIAQEVTEVCCPPGNRASRFPRGKTDA